VSSGSRPRGSCSNLVRRDVSSWPPSRERSVPPPLLLRRSSVAHSSFMTNLYCARRCLSPSTGKNYPLAFLHSRHPAGSRTFVAQLRAWCDALSLHPAHDKHTISFSAVSAFGALCRRACCSWVSAQGSTCCVGLRELQHGACPSSLANVVATSELRLAVYHFSSTAALMLPRLPPSLFVCVVLTAHEADDKHANCNRVVCLCIGGLAGRGGL
jgi:hypothetical protein